MSLRGKFERLFGIESDGNNVRIKNGQLAVTDAIVGYKSVATYSTAGVVTYTAAEVIGGIAVRDPNGAARADKFPTATDIVNAIDNCQVGDSIQFTVVNTADAAETITMTTNTGLTLVGDMTVVQNESKCFTLLVTNASSPAVSVYPNN